MGEWLLRELQRQAAGRVARWRDLLLAQGSPDRDRSLAAALQHDPAPLRPGLPPASPTGRAVAAVASLVTGRSGDHPALGAGGKNELTFQPDHSMGADQNGLRPCNLAAVPALMPSERLVPSNIRD